MTLTLQGSPASEGIAEGMARRLVWRVPEVPHCTVGEDAIETEVDRFRGALEAMRERLQALRTNTEQRLGPVEARIFEPQLLMLQDELLVDGTIRYVRENRLSAARAFDLRSLEVLAMWNRTQHPMVLDRLNDLQDLQVHLLHLLLDLPDPDETHTLHEPTVLVADDLTPSLTMRLDTRHVVGIVTEKGTRTSHWAILARSLGIPAVVGARGVLAAAEPGTPILLDGRTGRVVLSPGDPDRRAFADRRGRLARWEREVSSERDRESRTADGVRVSLWANLDLPGEAHLARRQGADGVGLFRTEFLVVGRSAMPDEEEQFEAYRSVVEAFTDRPVLIRTFDLGGDKFPLFLKMPAEENPFLGWRSVRVMLDRPDIFRPQVRAILRAAAFGEVRVMIPLVNTAAELREASRFFEEERLALEAAGVRCGPCPVGALVETPAAALHSGALARDAAFLSVGTNDLVQYTLAVDRTNARLQKLYDPFHPAVVRQLHRVARVGRLGGRDVSVCGEMAGNPVGAFLLLGLGFTALSVAWPAVPELRSAIRAIDLAEARRSARRALVAPDSRSVVEELVRSIGPAVDLSMFG
ncbi:MAG: phosphoenolpyruvate--protein phosphotransferase [Gemmatimonadota bacterium]